MGWFRTPKTTAPTYTGLQLQTSVSTLPIPIVWGQTKIAANVIWYTNFQSQGGGSGGKGGLFGGSSSSTTTYSADLMLALCEGPIANIGTIWKDQSVFTLAELGLTFFNGATPQTTWSYLSSTYPNQALAYQGTAWVGAASYSLGSNAAISNHNFEIAGILAGTGVNGVDADPAQVVNDFLTNPQYGAGFAPASINASTLFGAGGDASLQSYCRAVGVAFSPALINQEPASSVLTRWLQLLNCAAVWSGGQLKFIPYGDTTIVAGTNVATSSQVAVPTPVAPSSGPTPPPEIVVCPASQFVADGGVVYAFTGGALTPVGATAPSSAGTYGISPNGTYLFAPGDEGNVVVIRFTYSIPTGYSPNLAPIYNLTDYDFVDEQANKDPVQAARLDPFSLPTIQRLECLSRANQYGMTAVEARDQSQVEIYGPRVGTIIQGHEICDPIVVGPVVAQTILQRSLYVRTRYSFKLSWEYGLLDPMDIVTISDANLGLINAPVRIVTIEEDDKGLLAIVAEELTVGVSTPAAYPNAAPYGFQPNQGAYAQPVNSPLIYEPPASLTQGAPQLWLGASGGTGGVADPNWGGANVYLSIDNVTYSQVATITQRLRQGQLSASLAAAPAGWDTADILSVNLAESAGALSGASQAAAQQGATLSLTDSELVCYASATLTSSHAYNLTGLQRGMNGTAPAAHASGAQFARLDGAVVKYALPANLIGRALYFKFQSFNIFGGGVQNLAACVAYAFTPVGAGAGDPIAAQLATGVALDLGSVTGSIAIADDFGGLVGAASGTINLGTAP